MLTFHSVDRRYLFALYAACGVHCTYCLQTPRRSGGAERDGSVSYCVKCIWYICYWYRSYWLFMSFS